MADSNKPIVPGGDTVGTVGEVYLSKNGKTYECVAVIDNTTVTPNGETIPRVEYVWVCTDDGAGGGVQSDWNQNDDTQPDYVKNRPFYTGDPVETVLVEESTVSFSFSESEGVYMAQFPSTFEATVGETYKISWDGTVYECACVDFHGMTVIGNLSIPGVGIDTGEPFVMVVGDGDIVMTTADTSASHTVSISEFGAPEVVKIDPKYLPDNDNPLNITGATVGQIAKITAVDDTGKPTSWKTMNISSFAQAPFKPAGKSYLTFSSPSSFTLRVKDLTKHWDGTLEYFASNKTWTTWNGKMPLPSIVNGDKYVLYLRGTGNTVITGPNQNYKWVLTGSNIACIGNIENLLDYATVESGEHPTMASGCYSDMFKGCTALIQAPELPAMTLANNCYGFMFQGCTGLIQAPELPATTLASGCYSDMFKGCTALIQAPELPATTLASSCYGLMFDGCTGLIQAPELPATTLASGCYQYMFQDCTSLTQAPALPATTLVSSCYKGMFEGCTSLIQVPELPATTLADWCYQRMFDGCTSLKLSTTQSDEYAQEYRIPSSGEGVTARDALTDMFASTGGTFTGTPAINKTYYLSSDNMIVRDTEVATLNGYVGAMIDAAIDKYADTAEYIIPSSTQGSTKKFKIIVDDAGTLSATEVTETT